LRFEASPGKQIARPHLTKKKKKKKPSQKSAGGVAQGVGPEFKPQYWRGKYTKGWGLGSSGRVAKETQGPEFNPSTASGQTNPKTLLSLTGMKCLTVVALHYLNNFKAL
jgi:hypothetical protein